MIKIVNIKKNGIVALSRSAPNDDKIENNKDKKEKKNKCDYI